MPNTAAGAAGFQTDLRTDSPVVVIGAGLAGWTTVREFRKLDTTTPVVLITGDSGDFYAKPSLSNAFAQRRTPAQLVSTLATKMVETLNVTLMKYTQVESIDVATKVLQIRPMQRDATTNAAPAQPLAYRQLVLATGAQPIRIPVQGNAAQQVRSINSLDDFSEFYSCLGAHEQGASGSDAHRKTIVIMGAGLIGCEFANDLVQAGHRVQVVDPSQRPLAALLPEQASVQLRDALTFLGVVWHFGTTVQTVDTALTPDSAPGPAYPPLQVRLASGEVLAAHAVLSAIGLRADTRLAAAAGLACERGIVADAFLQTSASGVYALGDCAQYASAGHRTLPYVMPIMNAAKALAATLRGTPTPVVFPLMPVSIKTPALPIVAAPAHPAQAGAWVVDTSTGDAGTNDTGTNATGISDEGAHTSIGVGPGVWQFIDPQGVQRGFVLSGKHTARRLEQTQLTAL